MLKIRVGLIGLVTTAILAQNTFALEIFKKNNADLSVHGRMQGYGFLQSVRDDHRSDVRAYLFIKQTRLFFDGHYDDYKYHVELAFGGEETLDSNVVHTLLESRLDMPFFDVTTLRLGQFKVPYGRENLTGSNSLFFAERSLNALTTVMGRDVGALVYKQDKNFKAALGMFAGGGRDIPIRYLPQRLGFPLTIARVGYDSGIDEDMLCPESAILDNKKEGIAIFANVLYIKDSKIGHSTVLNYKKTDKSLALNSNWNPYMSLDQGGFWQAGADFSVRRNYRDWNTGFELEVNRSEFSNNLGTIQWTSGKAEVNALKNKWGFALRYAMTAPGERVGYYLNGKNYPILSQEFIHEVTPALTYFIKGTSVKVIVDAPVIINAPVVHEAGIGTYVLTEQPDQTSYVRTNLRERQTVLEGRLLFQVQF